MLSSQTLAGSPTISLGACHGVLSHFHSRTCVPDQGVAGNKTFSGPWGLLGTAGSLEQLPAAAGDREPGNACLCFPGFPGTCCPAAEVTGPHKAPLRASLLVHFIPL